MNKIEYGGEWEVLSQKTEERITGRMEEGRL